MFKKFYFLLLLVISPVIFAGVYAQPEVTPSLQSALSERSADEYISVNLRLVAQYDDKLLYQQSRAIKNSDARRSFVVNELKQFSSQHQADLLTYLQDMESQGKVRNIRSFWVGNLVNCEATPEVIQELITRTDLARVDYNKERQVLMLDDVNPGTPVNEPDQTRTPNNLAWNVTLVNADQVWDLGYTGEEVIVAVMDTGVNYNHLDITDNMWEHPDYPGHGYNFTNNSHNTMDFQGHGTHCAGTVAGTGAAGTGTGIAPGATIMNLQVLTSSGGGTEAGVWAGIQFAIDYGAHVMSLSLGWQHSWNPDRSMWRLTMNTALSAGVIAAVASGNEGGWGGQPPPSEVRTPGDVPPPWTHPDQTQEGGNSAVVSVGSTTSADVISGFSSKGPVTWQNVLPFNDYAFNPGTGLIRPDVVAPGSDVLSLLHSNNTGYTTKSGTSMATPAVAGLMALMLSKNPGLLPEDVNQILEETAIHMGPAGKNNTYGSGRIDALAAVLGTPYMGIRYVDHQTDDSAGNDDGNINPGEHIVLSVTMENPTEEDIINVEASLSSQSEYITIIESTAVLGDFLAGEAISFEDVFTFDVADNIPGNYEIVFEVTAFSTDEPEDVWKSPFTEMAHAPYLEFSNLIIDDTETGDGNGQLDPGETAEVHITLTNTGQLPTGEISVTMESDGHWITILSFEPQIIESLSPDESTDLVFDVVAFHDTPLESIAELIFSAITGAYNFTQEKEIVVGIAPYYSLGDIPSTYNTNTNTGSNALEPGVLTVTIPEGATITGVDVEYKMTSHGGAWMSEQRSFIRCVSEGGATEPQVYTGSTTNSGGTVDYHRTGLDIANGVEGGGDIEFELHAFRTWGGSGSNTQYVFVPNNSWKIIVYYQMPTQEVVFRVENQLGEAVPDANLRISNTEQETDQEGETTFDLPQGTFYLTATADQHRTINLMPLEILPDTDMVLVEMLRVFEVSFNILDVHGNEVQDAVIHFADEALEPGQYVVDDLEDGIYTFVILADGHEPYEGEVEIIDNDLVVDVALNPYYNVLFNIRDRWGSEVYHATITINDHTHDEGLYHIEDLIPGEYSFTITAEFFHDYHGEFNIHDNSLELDVELNEDGTNITDREFTELNMFPNPARESVRIEFYNDQGNQVAISLMNYTGQVIKRYDIPHTEGYFSTEIDISGITPGVYFVSINNTTKKLIIQ